MVKSTDWFSGGPNFDPQHANGPKGSSAAFWPLWELHTLGLYRYAGKTPIHACKIVLLINLTRFEKWDHGQRDFRQEPSRV